MATDSVSTATIGAEVIRGYRLEERLGQGSMGIVFRATQLSTGRLVALKVLRRRLARNRAFTKRFVREAQSAAKLRHPNIVEIFDAGESPEGYFFYSMEYVDGETLEARIDREGCLNEKWATEVMLAVASALEEAESADLVHRDVKPGNILLAADGIPKLADFGLARTGDDSTITEEGAIIGTPAYLSPEQARNGVQADIRSDIYSLGCTFFHAVTGAPPYEGPTLATVIAGHLNGEIPSAHERNRAVSPNASSVIQKMMAKEPKLRYRHAAELARDLRLLLRGRRPKAAKKGLSPIRALASLCLP